MRPRPPAPFVVHPLPPAPEFVGRASELDQLSTVWNQESGGVIALVGLGGAGKTALVARFLEERLTTSRAPAVAGLFVWSFYQQPDAGLFLEEAHRYFAGDAATASPARGAGLLHLLREALARGGPNLLVLDGLERVQQQGGTETGGYGRVEDPLLRGLLTRIAEGSGRTTAVVTSRFPLSDLEPFRGHGYRPIDVSGLDRAAALDLLRRRGVRGDDDALVGLISSYGAHALTLDHLGGLIARFLDGEAARAPEAPTLTAPEGDRQALRLARLLRAYEEHLPPAELALLCRLCSLRGSASEAQLLQFFGCSPPVQAGTARHTAALIARLPEPERRHNEEPLNLAPAALTLISESICTAPLAGPADDFPREVIEAVEQLLTEPEPGDEELDAFVRLYEPAILDAPTEHRPLPPADRERLPGLIAAYRGLRANPLLPHQAPMHHDALKTAFLQLGWGVPRPPGKGGKHGFPSLGSWHEKMGWEPEAHTPEDLSHQDLEDRFRRVQRRLRRLALKHNVLKRVHDVCRIRQQKWELAGPLAVLDAAAVCRTLAALVDRHLVLREADGSFSVHPAVRDHFARLGDASERGGWHDLIRAQLVSLVSRPGRSLPEDKPALDLVEEAIHYALESGRDEQAKEIYERGLGGLRHLGWKLGEMARGLRILRGFRQCPDRSAEGWFLRALGELDQAYQANSMPFFRADIRLLQGRLPEVGAEGDTVRTATASFLMGDETESLPSDVLGVAVPRLQLLLFLGRHHDALLAPRFDRLYGDIGWEGDRARSQLLMAEAARRMGDAEACRQSIEAASAWVLRSGSVEHLCLLHLVRAQSERDAGNLPAARRAADEGVHAASQSGLGLYHILLLIARAETLLADEPEAAERSAREALNLASAPNCRFCWGEWEARHLVGESLAAMGRSAEARALLQQALRFRRRVGDPRAKETQALLSRLTS